MEKHVSGTQSQGLPAPTKVNNWNWEVPTSEGTFHIEKRGKEYFVFFEGLCIHNLEGGLESLEEAYEITSIYFLSTVYQGCTVRGA